MDEPTRDQRAVCEFQRAGSGGGPLAHAARVPCSISERASATTQVLFFNAHSCVSGAQREAVSDAPRALYGAHGAGGARLLSKQGGRCSASNHAPACVCASVWECTTAHSVATRPYAAGCGMSGPDSWVCCFTVLPLGW